MTQNEMAQLFYNVNRQDNKVPVPVKMDPMECFVRKEFPLNTSENRSNYYKVGIHCFRINFWSERQDEKGSMQKESCITRSLFVQIGNDVNGDFCVKKVCDN